MTWHSVEVWCVTITPMALKYIKLSTPFINSYSSCHLMSISEYSQQWVHCFSIIPSRIVEESGMTFSVLYIYIYLRSWGKIWLHFLINCHACMLLDATSQGSYTCTLCLQTLYFWLCWPQGLSCVIQPCGLHKRSHRE